MIDDNLPTVQQIHPLIMQTASKHDIKSQSKSNLQLQSLPSISVHKFLSKDLSENLLSVNDLTSQGCEVLFTDTFAKVFKKNQLVALYPKSKECFSLRVPNDKVFIPHFTSSATAVSDNLHKSFSFLEKICLKVLGLQILYFDTKFKLNAFSGITRHLVFLHRLVLLRI